MGKKLKQLHIARQSGIAGWIMQNGKPMMVNNAEKNAKYYKRIDDATGFQNKVRHRRYLLIIDNKVIGVIEVLNKVAMARFHPARPENDDGPGDHRRHDYRKHQDERRPVTFLQEHRRALVSLADAKETSGGGHSRRVAEYALMGANELALSKEARSEHRIRRYPP